MRLVSRFGYAANQIRRDRPLTHEELIRHVPSIFGEDRLITERLVQALGLVDIRVPDHLIVGGNQVFSFAEHGLL